MLQLTSTAEDVNKTAPRAKEVEYEKRRQTYGVMYPDSFSLLCRCMTEHASGRPSNDLDRLLFIL